MAPPTGDVWSLDGTLYENQERVSTAVGEHQLSFTAFDGLTKLEDESITIQAKTAQEVVRQSVVSGFTKTPFFNEYWAPIPSALNVHRSTSIYGTADENGTYRVLSGSTLEDILYKHESKEYYILKVTATGQPYSNSMWVCSRYPDGRGIEDCLIAPPGKMPDDEDSINNAFCWPIGPSFEAGNLMWQNTDRWRGTDWQGINTVSVRRI